MNRVQRNKSTLISAVADLRSTNIPFEIELNDPQIRNL